MEFKIVYQRVSQIKEIEFSSQKSLYQWESRNRGKYACCRYYKNERGQWCHFVTVGSRILTLSELEKLVLKRKNEARALQLAKRSADTSFSDDKTTIEF